MDRCALFVDAGYALADGAMAVHGTRRRDSVSWDHAGLLKLLAGLARDRTGLPVLRCYWYETAAEGRRTAEHDALAEMPGLKLRLVNALPGRREGIESQLRRDLVTLAKSGAISDAFIASANEHIAEIVAEVQDLGLRVVILHIASDSGWTIPLPLRQECDDIVEISGVHLRSFVDLIRAEPAGSEEQYKSAPVGAVTHHGQPAAALPAPAAVYQVQDASEHRPDNAGYGRPGSPSLAEPRASEYQVDQATGASAHHGAASAPSQSGHQSAGGYPSEVGVGYPDSYQNGGGAGYQGVQMPNGTGGLGGVGRESGGQSGGQPGTAQGASDHIGAVSGADGPSRGSHGGGDAHGSAPGSAGQNGVGLNGVPQGGVAQSSMPQSSMPQSSMPQSSAGQAHAGSNGGPQSGAGRSGVPQNAFPGDYPGDFPADPGRNSLASTGYQQQNAYQRGPGQGGIEPNGLGQNGSAGQNGSVGQNGSIGQNGVSYQVPGQNGAAQFGYPVGQPGSAGPGAAAPGSAGPGGPGQGSGGPGGLGPGGLGPGGLGQSGIGPAGAGQSGAGQGSGGPGQPQLGQPQLGQSQPGQSQLGPSQLGQGQPGQGSHVGQGSQQVQPQGGPSQGGYQLGGHSGGPQNGLRGGPLPGGFQPVGGQPSAAQPGGGQPGGAQLGGGQLGPAQLGGGQPGGGQLGGGQLGPAQLGGGQPGGGQPDPRGRDPYGSGLPSMPPGGPESQPQPSAQYYGAPDASYALGQMPGQLGGPGPDQSQRPAFGPPPGQHQGPEGGGVVQPQYQMPQQAAPQQAPPPLPAVRVQPPVAIALPEAVKAAHAEGFSFGESVGRDAPGLWLEAVLARKPRMPSDLEARLLQGSVLPIDSLLHDEVRHSLRRGFWDALESARR